MSMLSGLPMPQVVTQAPDLRLRLPNRSVDMRWLDLDVFFPPGAKHIYPAQRLKVDLVPENRTRFPSAELCASPDKRVVLFHDGMKRKQNDIYHWLMLLKHDAPFPNAIFCTKLAFDASWAEDSSRFAVTHFVGDNSSEVFVVDIGDLERKPIDLKPVLEEHFPAPAWSAPMFVKAYRWSHDGRLIVRAVGRAREEPYELFGCEAVIGFAGPNAEPRLSFLRGYVLPQEER